MRREHGFSLLELTVAMAIMITVTGAIFSLLNPAQGNAQTQPEVADMQQRLRVSADTLYKDLVMTGNGAYQGALSGSLLYAFTPVMPFRQGTLNDDPPGTFKDDTITLMYVPPTYAQTSLANRGPDLRSVEIGVTAEPGCPTADQLCGFKEGMTVLMYDDSGNFDIFTITNVQESALHLQHRNDNLTYTDYAPKTTKIVQANFFEYYLSRATNQLMFYDGSGAPDVPVVDNVVGLKFEYYGEPQPPAMVDGNGLVNITNDVTYGPKPKGVPQADGTGDTCTIQSVGNPATRQPRLAVLGAAGTGLVKLTQAQLTDGPWCPDAMNSNRFDADLFRIRKIRVTLRVQTANAQLRGPATSGLASLWVVPGTGTGSRLVGDQQIRFDVTPRNMNLNR